MNREICSAVARVMEEGGYLRRLEDAGPGLERVRAFLAALAGQREPEEPPPGQGGWLWPPFPGLRSMPIHEQETSGATELLTANWRRIRDEVRAVPRDAFLAYVTKTTGVAGEWSVLPFTYMGTEMAEFQALAPATWSLIASLSRACFRYPWGDALVSRHLPGTHLPPHYSVDNLRLRCHLGLDTAAGAAIRVGDKVTSWHEGRTFLFEDAYEHEAWNRGDQPRLILIVDLWHPDLNDDEIHALLAGFRKREVREVFCDLRLRGPAARYREPLREAFVREDDDPTLREFWDF